MLIALSVFLPWIPFSLQAQEMSSPASFTLFSTAFENNHTIPYVYSRCDGDDISPPLEWSGVPGGTKSLALIVDDPDAPDPGKPKMTWVHWVVYNIPISMTSLSEGVDLSSSFSPDANGPIEAKNSWKKIGYGGPAPPIGVHRYFFKLYALDTVLPTGLMNKASLLEAMDGHVIEETQSVGTYKKGGNIST